MYYCLIEPDELTWEYYHAETDSKLSIGILSWLDEIAKAVIQTTNLEDCLVKLKSQTKFSGLVHL